MKKIKGVIWYSDEYYAGTEDEYNEFVRENEGVKVVYTFDSITVSQLSKLCDGLNEMNDIRLKYNPKIKGSIT